MIKIISDSTCDLSRELLEKYDVTILPLHVHLGEDEFQDGVNVTPEELYTWADANKTTPKTSSASITEVMDLFKAKLGDGDELICFAVSASMSSCHQVMCLAAQEMECEDRIHVIDSANLSTGIGLLILEAAVMAQEGKHAMEIVAEIERLKPRVRASFVVDTLTYLHRGGRCSSVAALAGGVLQLHPQIVVENGKMDAKKKYRGKIAKVIMAYAKDMEDALKTAKPDRVFITHSGCDAAVIAEVRAYLESLNVFGEILETRAGGVISSHCGPGTLGVLFIAG
ncbi:MAG: DegV family protein [Lachnospiraceae bacterium]|nr:DegV family protein [Lachnospiraceae bacterium]